MKNIRVKWISIAFSISAKLKELKIKYDKSKDGIAAEPSKFKNFRNESEIFNGKYKFQRKLVFGLNFNFSFPWYPGKYSRNTGKCPSYAICNAMQDIFQ